MENIILFLNKKPCQNRAIPIFLAFFISFFFVGISHGAGNTAAQFLKIPLAARAAAMTAYGAVADDPSAMLYNPAGLAMVGQNEADLSYLDYFTDTKAGFLGLAMPYETIGTTGIGVTYLNVSNLDMRDDAGMPLGTFGSSDFCFSLSYARPNFWNHISFGITAKYILETIAGQNADGYAGDVGLIYPINNLGLTLGLALQNFGTGLKFISETDPLPLDLKISSAYRPTSDWVISADADFLLQENKNYLSVGTEYSFIPPLAVRLGYNFGADLGGFSGLGAGLGLKVGGYSFDYALGNAGDLGFLHRISLGVKF